MISTILGIVGAILGLYLTFYLNEKNIEKSILLKIKHGETIENALKRAKRDGFVFIFIAFILLLIY